MIDAPLDGAAGAAGGEVHLPGVHPGQELRQLRRRRGVSLAGLARRIHCAKGCLSRVESGDKPLTPAVAEACDAALDTGGLPARLVATALPARLVMTALPAQRRQGADGGVCPYRGLAAYGTDDAGWFFGRERATAALVQVVTARLGAGPSDGSPVAASDDRGNVGVWRTADPCRARRRVVRAHTRGAVAGVPRRRTRPPGHRLRRPHGPAVAAAGARLPPPAVRVREFAGHVDGVHTVAFLDRDNPGHRAPPADTATTTATRSTSPSTPA
ncbi:helix-turn-helix domain-containing protein [Streptomyces cellulosae]